MKRLTIKRPIWRAAVLGGLVLVAGTTAFLDWNSVQAEGETSADSSLAQRGDGDGGGNRGGGGGNRGGGGGGNRGGGAPHAGGGTPHAGGGTPHAGGGTRTPSGGGSRQPSMGGQRPAAGQPPVNRTPSMSRPNPGRPPGTGNLPGVRIRPSVDVRNHGPAGGNRPHGNTVEGSRPPFNSGVRGNVEIGPNRHRGGGNYSHIGNRPYTGNTVNFNNRDLNLGNRGYQPSYYRHSGYHGYWNGNRFGGYGSGFESGLGYGLGSSLGYGLGYGLGGYNGYGWGLGYGGGYGGYGGRRYRPFGWGLGGWGLGSVYYNSGYLGYSNPYYVSSGPVYYNYSQPIPVSYMSVSTPIAENPADTAFNNAVAAFRLSDYPAALDITNKAIVESPDDAVLHEFRSLVLFAMQDYQQSAATIHSVLAVGPGWDWTTLIGLYDTAPLYTDQLRALETFTKANPQDAASHFLLGYHYMTCGHPDDAARSLREVVRLMPNDRVAADVLKMVAAPDPAQTGQAPPPVGDQAARPTPKPVDVATLIGTWNATRPDGSRFDLNLTKDSKFTWSFAQKDQADQKFDGAYTVEGNVLALERQGGGTLVAEITPSPDGKFNFKMLGAPDDDKGLNFQK